MKFEFVKYKIQKFELTFSENMTTKNALFFTEYLFFFFHVIDVYIINLFFS